MFKIRCSAISQIMANGRGKDSIGATAKTYCENWLKEQIYGRKKEIESKYLRKGIQQEEEAINLVAERYNLGMLLKCEESFSNDFMTGHPDIFYKDVIRDTKCSWDAFTFPLFDENPDPKYVWQLQGYMALTGAKVAYLDYCLVNTPESEIERELNNKAYNGELTEELENEIRAYHNYDDIDIELRVKTYKIERDESAIKQIETRVAQCRDHISKLEKSLICL